MAQEPLSLPGGPILPPRRSRPVRGPRAPSRSGRFAQSRQSSGALDLAYAAAPQIMVEPAPNMGVERRLDDASRQDIGLPANSAVPPDVACGAAVAVLDPFPSVAGPRAFFPLAQSTFSMSKSRGSRQKAMQSSASVS